MELFKKKKRGDNLGDVEQSDLLQLSSALLDSVVASTNVLEIRDMTPEKLKECKLVLGYLNATNSVMKTKLGFFKMVGLAPKLDAIKKKSGLLK